MKSGRTILHFLLLFGLVPPQGAVAVWLLAGGIPSAFLADAGGFIVAVALAVGVLLAAGIGTLWWNLRRDRGATSTRAEILSAAEAVRPAGPVPPSRPRAVRPRTVVLRPARVIVPGVVERDETIGR